MSEDRVAAYEELAALLRRYSRAGGGPIDLKASLPGETRQSFETRAGSLRPAAAAILRAARRLDDASPLERDEANGVWETVVAEAYSGRSWICVANSAGDMDHVTTFGTGSGTAPHFSDWCACREGSVPGDTPWDEARRERRVVDYGGVPTVIDRGASFVIDAVVGAGCRTMFSCEGHPQGAYLHFHGETQERIGEEFRRLGWTVEGDFHAGGVTVRMPPVSTVAERDAEWRRLSLELSVEPAPGPGI